MLSNAETNQDQVNASDRPPYYNHGSVEADLQSFLLFIWRVRFFLIIFALSGGVIGGLFSFITSSSLYQTRFLVFIDKSSMPKVYEQNTMARELNALLSQTDQRRFVLDEILKDTPSSSIKDDPINKSGNGERKDLLSHATGGDTAQSVVSSSSFQFSEGPENHVLTVNVEMPINGYQDRIGPNLVKALNALIGQRNEKEQKFIESLAISRLKYHSLILSTLNERTLADKVDLEKSLLTLRSELATLEDSLFNMAGQAELSSIASTIDQRKVNTSRRSSSFSGSRLVEFDTSVRNENFAGSVDRSVLLVSALNRSGRLNKSESDSIFDQLSQVSARYYAISSQLESMKDLEISIVRRINDISLIGQVDPTKTILPSLSLDKEYYQTLLAQTLRDPKRPLMEVKTSSRGIARFIIIGFLLGGTLAFFGSMVFQLYFRGRSDLSRGVMADI